MNIINSSPLRHAFLAKELFTGMKLAKVPIDDPPTIDPKSTKIPITRM